MLGWHARPGSGNRPAAALNPHPIAGDFQPDGTTLAGCRNWACWAQAFGNLAYREGPRAALAAFDRRVAADEGVESGCHRIAHTIGSAALARYSGNVARAFAEGSSSCASGYYHGILEHALAGTRSKAELVTVARRLCADDGVRTSTFLAYQCVHGIGHGLMIHTGLDLPWSLSVCEQLATEWDQTSCDGGVFMENFNSSYGVRSRYVRPDDPLYPCNAVAERHQGACYLQVTDRLLVVFDYDWKKTATGCTAVAAPWRAACFQSFGRNASGAARLDVHRLVALCGVPPRPDRGDCVYGAVRDVVNNDAGAKRAGRFCRLVELRLRARCFSGAGTILATLAGTARERRAMCAEIAPSRYLGACLRGTA